MYSHYLQVEFNMYSHRGLQPHITAIIAAVVLLIAFGIYSTRGNAYAPDTSTFSTRPPLTNSEKIKNWLPDISYSYTIARIDDYLAHNQLSASSMSVTGYLTTQESAYQFTITLLPSGTPLAVSVKIINYSPIISTAVSINGTLQSPTYNPSQTTTFTGITDLINSGLTATEANNLQVAFTKFAPSTGSISIDPASITHVPIDVSSQNPIISYTFSVKIDNTIYGALLHCPDLSSVQLILTQNKHQVFDSGLITSQ
jgi:hypothetical protein